MMIVEGPPSTIIFLGYMNYMNRHFLILGILGILGICLFSARASAELSSFVADAVQDEPGQEVRRGKLYVSPLGTRFEYVARAQKVIQIIQPSRGLFWLLFPRTMTYFEVKSTPSKNLKGTRAKVPCVPDGKAVCKKLGTVKIGEAKLERWLVGDRVAKSSVKVLWDPRRRMFIKQEFPDGSTMEARQSGVRTFEGLTVEPWKMTYSYADGRKEYSYMLYAPDLGFPVMEQGSKGLVKELHNIKPYAQDASLYKIPNGYKKIAIPLQKH